MASITTRPEATALTPDDLLLIVDDPAGTPASKKVTAQNVSAFTTGRGFRQVLSQTLYGVISEALTWAAAQTFSALATFNAGAAINAALTITANLAGALHTINQQGTGDALVIQDGGVTRSRFPDGGGIVLVPQAGGFSVITGLVGYDNTAAGFERLKFQHEGHTRPVPIDPRNAFRNVQSVTTHP